MSNKEKVTWFEIGTQGGDTYVNAMMGNIKNPHDRLWSAHKHLIMKFMERYPNANNVIVAPDSKYVDGLPDLHVQPKTAMSDMLADLTAKIFDGDVPQLTIPRPIPTKYYPRSDRTPYNCNVKGRIEWPEGVVIHYPVWTQDPRRVDDLARMRENNGHTYLIMDGAGQLWQDNEMTEWGWHAGRSRWPGVTGNIISCRLLGIEVCSWGKLNNSRVDTDTDPWGNEIQNTRYGKKIFSENVPAGTYQAFTVEQLKTLTEFILWAHLCKPEIFKIRNVVGHSEVAIPAGRKPDPGWAMPVPMHDYRAYLELLLEERAYEIV